MDFIVPLGAIVAGGVAFITWAAPKIVAVERRLADLEKHFDERDRRLWERLDRLEQKLDRLVERK